MTRQRVVALVLVAALVLSGAALLVGQLASGGSHTSRSAPSTSPTAGPSPGSEGKGTKGSRTTKGGSATSEIAPVKIYNRETRKNGGLPGLGKRGAAPTGPLVTRPTTKPAVRRGGVARGFPVAVIPVVPRSTVRSTGVSPSSGRLQVALDGRVATTRADVLRFYAVRLGRYGFAGSVAPAVGGAQAVAYTRKGGDSLTVTVTKLGKHRTGYTLFGTLRTTKR